MDDPDADRRHDGTVDTATGGSDDGRHRPPDRLGTRRPHRRRSRRPRPTPPLADLPDCPTDALDEATGPVEITFWHGLANELETSLIALTDAYNASQDRVRVDLQNQTSYDSAIDKYIQSSQDSRPDRWSSSPSTRCSRSPSPAR